MAKTASKKKAPKKAEKKTKPVVEVPEAEEPEAAVVEPVTAEPVAEPIERIQGLFGIKSDRPVSCKCPSCGAALNGIKGETIKCPYCGTFYTF